MKNLIYKWLGLSPWAIEQVVKVHLAEEIKKLRTNSLGFTKLNGNGGLFDLVEDELNRNYDLDGMYSKIDDMKYLLEDLESRVNDWDNNNNDQLEDIKDQLEDIDFDKVQELDDRLTELLAGYKLEVKLTQENY